MAIQGLRTAADFVTDQRPKSWREGISILYPNGQAPLTALTSLMKSRKVDDPEFNWWEKTMESRRVALGATMAASSTGATSTLTVSSGAKGAKTGDLLYIENTGEVVRVAANPTSDTALVVTRGFAGTSAATAVNPATAGVNPNLQIIGSAFPEGSQAPSGVNFDPVKKNNYTQIHRSTLEITRTAMKTRLRTGDAVKEAKRECLELHTIDLERAYILGAKSETIDGATGKPIRTSGGVKSFLSASNIKNVATDYSSGLTMEGLELYMEQLFKYGSSEKLGLCGNRALTVINQVIRKNSQWMLEPTTKEYGFFNVQRLITPHGALVLKTHPLFNQNSSGTTGGTAYYGMDSWLLALDMAQVGYVYIDDTQYQTKLQDNGLDGEKSGYLTECGLEFGQADCHMLFTGFNKAVKDS